MGKDQSAPAHHSDWKNWTLDPWHRAGRVVPGRAHCERDWTVNFLCFTSRLNEASIMKTGMTA